VIEVKYSVLTACEIAIAYKGVPFNNNLFFPGKPFEFLRAQIVANRFNFYAP
jgi:hypothetical protein